MNLIIIMNGNQILLQVLCSDSIDKLGNKAWNNYVTDILNCSRLFVLKFFELNFVFGYEFKFFELKFYKFYLGFKLKYPTTHKYISIVVTG